MDHQSRSRRRGRLVLFGILLVPALCASSPEEPLSANLTAFRVTTDAKGVEQAERCDSAKPGDTIEYRLVYANSAARDLQGLAATLPLPEAVAYADTSAKPAAVEASVDGATFAPAPLRREAKQPDGSSKVVDVPTTEYRALRWQVGTLKAGASVTLTARVKIADSSPVSAAR